MYVITVLFSIKPQHTSAFLQLVAANARSSVAEETGCRQFDVCISGRDSNDVFLYEVYDSKEAFDEHLASTHYRRFNEFTMTWVTSKVVNIFERTFPRVPH